MKENSAQVDPVDAAVVAETVAVVVDVVVVAAEAVVVAVVVKLPPGIDEIKRSRLNAQPGSTIQLINGVFNFCSILTNSFSR